MGTEVKGNMYCRRCDKPVLAQKSTHKIARTALFSMTGLPTAGAWLCPDCGGKAVRYTGQDATTREPIPPAEGPRADVVITAIEPGKEAKVGKLVKRWINDEEVA